MSLEPSTTTDVEHQLIDIDDQISALNQFRPEGLEQLSEEPPASGAAAPFVAKIAASPHVAESSTPRHGGDTAKTWRRPQRAEPSRAAESVTSSRVAQAAAPSRAARSAPAPRSSEIAVPPRAHSYAAPAYALADVGDLDLRPFDPARIEPARSQSVWMAVLFGVCVGCLGWYALLHSEDLRSLVPTRAASTEAPTPLTAVALPGNTDSLVDSRPVGPVRPEATAVRTEGTSPASSSSTPWRAIGSSGTSQTQSVSTGMLIVDSHPVGATVFLDGAAVGQTPTVIPEVGVGNHTIRLALDNHHDWTSPVRVSPGEQNRVTASLEEEQPPSQ